jgi:four helix bundle protein
VKRYSFEDLKVWQEARKLAVMVYELTRSFPKEEMFGLSIQMRRAAISIASNIAEGSSRGTKKDQLRFYEIAYGSAIELLNQCVISTDLGLMTKEKLHEIRECISGITYMLHKLRVATSKSNYLREPNTDYENDPDINP